MTSNESDFTQLAGHQQHLVTFRLYQQIYALPIEPVVQIMEMVNIQPLPQATRSLAGVINVRGVAVPVINVRSHLGLPPTSLQLHTPIILVQVDKRQVGLIVDEVIDVLSLLPDQVTPLENLMPNRLGSTPILRGLVHTTQGIVLILDLENLLLAEQTFDLSSSLDALQQVMTTAEMETRDSVAISETGLESSDNPIENYQGELEVNA